MILDNVSLKRKHGRCTVIFPTTAVTNAASAGVTVHHIISVLLFAMSYPVASIAVSSRVSRSSPASAACRSANDSAGFVKRSVCSEAAAAAAASSDALKPGSVLPFADPPAPLIGDEADDDKVVPAPVELIMFALLLL